MIATRLIFWLCFLLSTVVSLGCASVNTVTTGNSRETTTQSIPARSAKPLSKVSPELDALYRAYREAVTRNVPFRSDDPLLVIDDGRVAIDAVAVQDGKELQERLVGLGLRNAVSFGRVVSGQFPIEAIPALEGVDALAGVRAASVRRKSHRSPEMPAAGWRTAMPHEQPVSGRPSPRNSTCSS